MYRENRSQREQRTCDRTPASCGFGLNESVEIFISFKNLRLIGKLLFLNSSGLLLFDQVAQ